MTHDPRHSEAEGPLPGGEELDALLRQWHRENAERAAAGREALMARLRAEGEVPGSMSIGAGMDLPPLVDDEFEDAFEARRAPARRSGVVVVLRRLTMHRPWTVAAAAVLLLAALVPFALINHGGKRGGVGGGAMALGPADAIVPQLKLASLDYVMCPDAGRLDARDGEGNILGPCSLKHTDVVADVSGFLTRVTITQKYHNPYQSKIEAVYTFPLSERAAVDRMTMTIGNRVIAGQVKERAEARRIYEEAKASNRIASLLEQERPNVFTQSIANIEPGADIDITISYVETTKQVGGVFEFDFPTTITPRFVPGNPVTGDVPPPTPRPDVRRRHGLVLLAPATISELQPGDTTARGTLTEAQLSGMLRRAEPIRAVTPSASIWYSFRAAYPDGSAEIGTLYTDGLGVLNGRWFCVPEHVMPGQADVRADAGGGGGAQPGAPFSPNTDRVPDASRVTPMPVRPDVRAGHDISITVNIDTGGPALGMVSSALHEVVTQKDAPGRATVTLKNSADIPNRDFVLKWRQESREVEPAVFTYTGDRGNFFAVQLTPPPAMNDDEVAAIAVPREMIFVLDVSGSMKGRPIEKAKEVLDKALTTLRPGDRFNVIRFNNNLTTLWPSPRQATVENLAEARAFYNQEIGGGGTQMYPAIKAAYRAGDADVRITGITPMELANLPADGREVIVDAPVDEVRIVPPVAAPGGIHADVALCVLRVSPTIEIEMPLYTRLPARDGAARSGCYRLTGHWETIDGRRVFSVRRATLEPSVAAGEPFRVIVFLTDGAIANENEVLAEIRAQRGRAAIFSFAIGNAPNRYLLDSMARLGRGEVEYVYETTSADEVIARFAERIRTPVLTNIKVEFSPNLNVLDVMTALSGGGTSVAPIEAIPDLFDAKPLTILGRYNQPATGTVTIRGMTASGPYRRVVNLDLPAPLPREQVKAMEEVRAGLESARAIPERVREGLRRDTIATLWARAKVEDLMSQDLRGVLANNVNEALRRQIVAIGESFNIVTEYTSFVAVDRLRITVGGKPRLIHIPVELPAGTRFEGFFGEPERVPEVEDDLALLHAGEWRYRFVPQEQNGRSLGYAVLAVESAAAGVSVDALGPVPGDSAVGLDSAATSRDRMGYVSTTAAPSANPAPAARPAREIAARMSRSAERGGAPAEKARPAISGTSGGVPGREGARGLKDEGVKKAVGHAPAADAPGKRQESAPSTPPPPPPPPSPPPPAPTPVPTASLSALGLEPAPASEALEELAALREELKAREDTQLGAGTYTLTPDAADNSAFFGFISSDLRVDGIDPAQAADAAKVLELYFTEQSEGAAPAAAPSAADQVTSHPSRGAPGAGARQRVVLAEHVILRIAGFASEGKVEAAGSLASALSDALPRHAGAAELKRVLTDASVSVEERTRVVNEQSEAAKARLAAILREAKLRQRLSASLLPFATTMEGLPAELGASYQGPWPEGASAVDGGVLLSVLVADTGDGVRAALGAAGLRIEGVDSQTRVVVGVAPLGKLADIALVDGVRRVEETRE